MLSQLRENYFYFVAHPAELMLLSTALLALIFAGTKKFRLDRLAPPVVRLCLWIGGIVLAVLSVTYFTSDTLMDHVEAQVAAAAAWARHGGTVYHLLDGANAYGLGYGPALYRIVQLAYDVGGESIRVAKLTTLAALLCTLGSLAIALRQRGVKGWGVALGKFALSSLVVFGAAVWLRADPFLVAVVALGWLILETTPAIAAAISLGVLMALAANLKLHGPAYFLPLLGVLLARKNWRILIPTFAICACGYALPLLPWQTAGEPYLEILRINTRHGLSLSHFITNLEFLLLLSAPFFAALLEPGRAPFSREEKHAGAGLALAAAAVSVVASKPGAGAWHLLPLLPSLTLLTALRPATAPGTLWPAGILSRALLASWALTSALLAVTRYDGISLKLWSDPAQAQIAEVRQILRDYSGKEIIMGTGDNHLGPGHPATFVRPVLIYAGQPYHFDPAAVMDLRNAHYPDEICVSLKMFSPVERSVMLIPHGETPFGMQNYYGGPLFPASFQADFLLRYRRAEERRFFDIWLPKTSS